PAGRGTASIGRGKPTVVGFSPDRAGFTLSPGRGPGVRGNGAKYLPRTGTIPKLSNSESPPAEPEVSPNDYELTNCDICSNREIVVFRLHQLGRRLEHAGSDRQVGSRVDQDAGTGQTIVRVTVEDERPRGAETDFADVVHRQLGRLRLRVESRDVDAVLNTGDERLNSLGGVLEEIFPATVQRTRVHPANLRGQVGAHARQVFQPDDRVAAANIEVVLEDERDGLRTKRFLQ